MTNITSPAKMTIIARTASKFCAHIRAALPEMSFLDLISLVISGTIEPWPECQPKGRGLEGVSRLGGEVGPANAPGPGTHLYIYIYIERERDR